MKDALGSPVISEDISSRSDAVDLCFCRSWNIDGYEVTMPQQEAMKVIAWVLISANDVASRSDPEWHRGFRSREIYFVKRSALQEEPTIHCQCVSVPAHGVSSRVD